jgi:hypothetical protein
MAPCEITLVSSPLIRAVAGVARIPSDRLVVAYTLYRVWTCFGVLQVEAGPSDHRASAGG